MYKIQFLYQTGFERIRKVRIHHVLQYKNIKLKLNNSNLNRNKNKLNLTMFRVKYNL